MQDHREDLQVRILVTGSRIWTDVDAVALTLYSVVDDLHPKYVWVVHGDCPLGVDRIARLIAGVNRWNDERHPADWDTYGRRAGYVRNAEMVKLGADICLAFIKNKSRGASMCADLAEKNGIPTRRFIG